MREISQVGSHGVQWKGSINTAGYHWNLSHSNQEKREQVQHFNGKSDHSYLSEFQELEFLL